MNGLKAMPALAAIAVNAALVLAAWLLTKRFGGEELGRALFAAGLTANLVMLRAALDRKSLSAIALVAVYIALMLTGFIVLGKLSPGPAAYGAVKWLFGPVL